VRPEKYTPKAREAFGKSMLDIGDSILKGIILLFTLAPLTYLAQAAGEGKAGASMKELLAFMSTGGYFVFLGLLIVSFFVGHIFRLQGLKHIHEAELKTASRQRRSK